MDLTKINPDAAKMEVLEVECDVCGQSHITEDCPELGLSTSEFKAQISRARLTVPHYLGIIDYPDGEVGIIATEPISCKTQLGPFEAKRTFNINKDDIFILKILSADGNTICLDASSENHCNWMALVQVAATAEEQNCMAYQLGINIYFNTTKDIAVNMPLKVWYAPKYAEKLGKSPEPDGKTRSMLGMDITAWRTDCLPQANSCGRDEGIIETAAYLASVYPQATALPNVLVKEETGQVYKCTRCWQIFSNQNDFAIHLRGHLMPTSITPESTRGRRGRPWGRAGVTHPLGKRGPGRPRKNATFEPGEVQHRRPGRPRKLQAEELAPPGAIAGQEQAPARPEGVEQLEDLVQQHSDVWPEDIKEEPKPLTNQVDNLQAETSGNHAAEIGDGSEGKVAQLGDAELEQLTVVSQRALATSVSVPALPMSAVGGIKKRRGRPPKARPLELGEIAPEATAFSLSSSSVRVQPRRTLKGKRTSTFLYPGESSSEEEEGQLKGKNVVKLAIKSSEYSDDDFDVSYKNVDDDEGGLEAGPVETAGLPPQKEAVQIVVQTSDGMVISQTPVMMLGDDDMVNKTETVEPPTFSIVSSGTDENGQQVFVLSAPMPAITVTAPLTVSADPVTTTASLCDQEQPLAAGTGPVHETQPYLTQEIEAPSTTDGLATLVDAALSSQKMDGGVVMETKMEYASVRVKAEDETSDDPDWKGTSSNRSSLLQKKRKYKRRLGDDPDLELLEASIQAVDGPNGTQEYACGVCSKRFQQLKYLKLHLPSHTNRFLCKDCGRRFARHESLQKHVCEDWLSLVERIQSEEDGSLSFSCLECGRVFTQMEPARRHVTMHKGMWVCSTCQKTFGRRQFLLDHKCGQNEGNESGEGENSAANSGEEDEEGEFTCDICKQGFRNKKYLFRHMAMHTELFKCESCGKCYSRKDSLQRHVLKCCPEMAEDYSVFACEKCQKTFGTRLGLENHTLNCGKFQCKDCRVAFFSEEDLGSHKCEGKIVDESTGVQFPCKDCGKTFASLPYLARHEAAHHAAFLCEICKKVFVRKEDLTFHSPVCEAVAVIEKEGKTTCQVCQIEVTDSRQFREHYQIHTHPYRCDKCGKRFIKVGTLHTHKCDNTILGVSGGELDGVWQCELCEKTFKNERYLARHKQLHGMPSFDCEYCGKKFIRKDYLNDHKCVLPDGRSVRVVRKKNRLYIRGDLTCPHCNKCFSSRSNLNKHIRVHGEKQAECHICNKRFHYESYLKLHVATVHDKQFQYICAHCGKILFSKTGLAAHVKQFHQESVKLYACPTCGKTFRQKGNMRTHLYSHTKERTFRCNMCPKAFKYPDQLNRHRLEHTMNNKFRCQFCDKRFVRESELRQHNRFFHSGVVYTCHLCHESCAHKHTIIRHYRRKHPELAEVFDKQPDFIDTLQKPADKTTSLIQRLPFHYEHKPKIVRVMQDGQEQEYIITAAPGHHEEMMEVGEDGMPYTTLTREQMHEVLPEEAVQALQNMSGAMLAVDGSGMIQQTVVGPDGQQTVIILQVVGQEGQDMAQYEGEHISIQQITMENGLDVEEPVEVATETADGELETMNIPAGSMMEGGSIFEGSAMGSIIVNNGVLGTTPDGVMTLVTSGMAAGDYAETGGMQSIVVSEAEQVDCVSVDDGGGDVSMADANTYETVVLETEDGESVIENGDTMHVSSASSDVYI